MLALKRTKQKTVNVPNDTLFEPIAPKGIISYVARISPSDAKFLLEMNQKNRAISDDTIRRYSADMVDSCWKDSASQIQISSEGNLLNGQHRLRAILSSNTSQILTVTEGVPEDSFAVMDVGRGRSAADALSVIDTKHYVVAASAIKMWQSWDNGFTKGELAQYSGGTAKRGGLSESRKYRNLSKASQIDSVLKFAESAPNLEFICSKAKVFNKAYRPITSAMFGCFLIQADRLGHQTLQLAIDFCEKLTSGAGLEENNPILTMRNRVQGWVVNQEYNAFNNGYKLKLLVHVWNAWVRGKKLTKRFKPKEQGMEEMLACKEV